MDTLKHIKRYIEEANTIVLAAHIHADGDAVGSVGAMYHFLRELGKEVYMLLPNLVDTYNFLPDIETKVDSVSLDKYFKFRKIKYLPGRYG